MQSLIKQLNQKYPFCRFGLDEGPLFMQVSVIHKRYKKNNVRLRNVELAREPQYYANQYMDMIKEIHENNVPPQRVKR